MSPIAPATGFAASVDAASVAARRTVSEAKDPLLQAAQSFEAAFLAEMLSHAGAAKGQDFGGGGYAEETFRSLLAREWADEIAAQGGIGLARHIYEALVADAKPDGDV